VNRLRNYVIGVLALLGAIEGAFRLWSPAFAACGDRILTKAGVLDRHDRVDVLFYGTSRFWDAVSPRLYAQESSAPEMRGFNLAVTSSTLETLEMLARRFAPRPDVRLHIVELSGPQLELARPEQPSPPDAVADFAARHSRLIEYRAALRGESLERLPELLFYPTRMDGSEILLADQLEAAFGRPEPRAPQIDLRPFQPAVRSEPLTPDPRAERMLAVGRLLRVSAPVVFVVPPIQKAEPHLRPYVTVLAKEFPVWDFSDAPLPAPMFRDTTHLSKEGRALFSRLLAVETARTGLLPASVSRR
jgi:hypothetical protein